MSLVHHFEVHPSCLTLGTETHPLPPAYEDEWLGSVRAIARYVATGRGLWVLRSRDYVKALRKAYWTAKCGGRPKVVQLWSTLLRPRFVRPARVAPEFVVVPPPSLVQLPEQQLLPTKTPSELASRSSVLINTPESRTQFLDWFSTAIGHFACVTYVDRFLGRYAVQEPATFLNNIEVLTPPGVRAVHLVVQEWEGLHETLLRPAPSLAERARKARVELHIVPEKDFKRTAHPRFVALGSDGCWPCDAALALDSGSGGLVGAGRKHEKIGAFEPADARRLLVDLLAVRQGQPHVLVA